MRDGLRDQHAVERVTMQCRQPHSVER
jgi:hypothetical protein